MAVSGSQIGALTRRRFPGLNYENLVQVQAKNLPALYSAAQANEAAELDRANSEKELSLAQDRINLERENLAAQSEFSRQQIEQAKKQAEIGKYTGAIGTGLNMYTAYKTGQLVDKLATGTVKDAVTGVEGPGMLSRMGTSVNENVLQPIGEVAKTVGRGIVDTARSATDALGLTKPPVNVADVPVPAPGTDALTQLPQDIGGGVSTPMTSPPEPGVGLRPPGEVSVEPIGTGDVITSEGLTGAIPEALTADVSGGMSTATGEVLGSAEEAFAMSGAETGSSSFLGPGGIAALAAIAIKMSYEEGARLTAEHDPGTYEHARGEVIQRPISMFLDPIGSFMIPGLEHAGVDMDSGPMQFMYSTQRQEAKAYEGMGYLFAGDWDNAGASIRASLTPEPIAKLTGKSWLCVATAMYVGMNLQELQYTRQISDYATQKYSQTFWFYLNNGYKLIRRIKDSGLNLKEFFSEVKKTLVDDSIEFVKKGEMDNAAYNYWAVTQQLFARFMPELRLPHLSFSITV